MLLLPRTLWLSAVRLAIAEIQLQIQQSESSPEGMDSEQLERYAMTVILTMEMAANQIALE